MTTSIDDFDLDDFEDGHSDSLEELHAERLAADPSLAQLVEAAVERRAFMRAMAAERKTLKISQAEVARRMGTSQAFVSRLERAEVDPQHSTEDRYAQAIGRRVERTLIPRQPSAMPMWAMGDSLGAPAAKRKTG
jgi:DNA-binding transcriptional regulator YiaG